MFLLTGNRDNLAKLVAAGPVLDSKLQELRSAPAAEGRATEISAIEAVAKPLLAQLRAEAEARGAAGQMESVLASTARIGDLVTAIERLKGLEMAEFEAVNKETGDAADGLENLIVFGSPAVLLVVAIIGFLVVRNITVPLARIESAAGRMAGGDFTVSPGDTGRGDEIGRASCRERV